MEPGTIIVNDNDQYEVDTGEITGGDIVYNIILKKVRIASYADVFSVGLAHSGGKWMKINCVKLKPLFK
jgi:hypothetical protein